MVKDLARAYQKEIELKLEKHQPERSGFSIYVTIQPDYTLLINYRKFTYWHAFSFSVLYSYADDTDISISYKVPSTVSGNDGDDLENLYQVGQIARRLGSIKSELDGIKLHLRNFSYALSQSEDLDVQV